MRNHAKPGAYFFPRNQYIEADVAEGRRAFAPGADLCNATNDKAAEANFPRLPSIPERLATHGARGSASLPLRQIPKENER